MRSKSFAAKFFSNAHRRKLRKTLASTRSEKSNGRKVPLASATLYSGVLSLSIHFALHILHIEKSFRWQCAVRRVHATDCKDKMKPKRTILCVDDNEQSLSHRKIMLETRGYRVASFSAEKKRWRASCRAVSTW